MTALLLSLATPLAFAGDMPDIDTPHASGTKSARDGAIVLSVETYDNLPDADYAARDGAAFKSWLTGTHGVTSSKVKFNSKGDAATLRKTLKSGATRAKSGGTLWVYFAGHAAQTPEGWMLLASDAPEDLGSLGTQGISLAEVQKTLAKSKADQVVVMVDASFSGHDRGGAPMFDGDPIELDGLPEATSDKFLFWLADTSGAGALGFDPAEHGLFTYFAVGAMRGWADGAVEADGTVTLAEAQHYVTRQLRLLGRPQDPSQPAPDSELVVVDKTLEKGPKLATVQQWGLDDRFKRVAMAESQVRKQVAAAYEEARAKAEAGDRAALETFITDHSYTTAMVSWALFVPEVDAARTLLADPDAFKPAVAEASSEEAATEQGGAQGASQASSEPAKEPEPEPAKEPEPVAEAEPAAEPEYKGPPRPSDCSDYQMVEPFALMGQLGKELQHCLEGEYAKVDLQTDKDKISRLLLMDAEARGDRVAWGRLLGRHLEEVDRSDPDLCFKYALYLSKQGPDRSEEVIKWADTALENKQVWKKATFKRRLYDLYRLRAQTANDLWTSAEERYISDRSDKSSALAEKWRNDTKQYAKEWLDYAYASGQNPQRALAMCTTAAGTPTFCEQ